MAAWRASAVTLRNGPDVGHGVGLVVGLYVGLDVGLEEFPVAI